LKKLLLHICCAPCCSSALKGLKKELSAQMSQTEDFSISFYWHNPNIWDLAEYNKRKDSALLFAKSLNIDFIEEKDFVYDYEAWKLESAQICLNCYKIRLLKAILYTKNNNFDYFSTSLLASPYQNHQIIKETALQLSEIYGIDFFYADFREFFYEGKNELRKNKIKYYFQKYCGCKKSYEKRLLNKKENQ
jgi:predicted adenine nucleotide alpha hydrolase (AANH) superfamily ATPase